MITVGIVNPVFFVINWDVVVVCSLVVFNIMLFYRVVHRTETVTVLARKTGTQDNLGKLAPLAKSVWISMKQEMMGWQWHELDHIQIICTSLQTDNHASTSSLDFWQAGCSSWRLINSVKALKTIVLACNFAKFFRLFTVRLNSKFAVNYTLNVSLCYPCWIFGTFLNTWWPMARFLASPYVTVVSCLLAPLVRRWHMLAYRKETRCWCAALRVKCFRFKVQSRTHTITFTRTRSPIYSLGHISSRVSNPSYWSVILSFT